MAPKAKPAETDSTLKREVAGRFTPPDWAWWVCAGIVVVGCVVGNCTLAIKTPAFSTNCRCSCT